MKKVRAIFAVLTVVTLFGTAALFCSAGGGGNSVEKGIVGTWINNEDTDEKWTFGADGSMTRGGEAGGYGVTDGMLSMIYGRNEKFGAWNATISSDGKTLILLNPVSSSWWLTKQQ